MRQCDRLDGLVDGVINNYMACRAIFDVETGRSRARPGRPGDALTTSTRIPRHERRACLTDGQIARSRWCIRRTLRDAAGQTGRSHLHWFPNTTRRQRADRPDTVPRQEGAADDAPCIPTSACRRDRILMRDLKANPLDYVDGGR